MSNQKPSSAVLHTIVALAVLLGLYVGTYYAMVQRAAVAFEDEDETWPPYYAAPESISAGEHIGEWEQCLRWFFTPIHLLDCSVRPRVWEMPAAGSH